MKIFKHIVFAIIIVILILLVLFPLYYLIVLSFTSNDQILKNIASLLPDGFHYENYKGLIDREFWYSFLLTFLSVLILIVLKLGSTLLAAFGLNKVSLSLRKILFIFFLITSFIPEISIYLYLFRTLNEARIINNDSLAFVLSLTMLFSFFMLMLFYSAINKEYENKKNVMRIDRINGFQAFFHIYLPKLKVPIYLLIIFTTIEGWNSFLWPQLILSGRVYNDSMPINTISTWFIKLGMIDMLDLINVRAAGAFISTLIPLSIYFVCSRIINKRMYKMVS
ncbi:ABC transporter permease subunit [Mycoplasma bradburyae]|uniref:ABC transporter permease subunit n=1 Tax=Mycoplasma bradburyae TaxID=2963128 RepID=UPI0020CF6DAF|nr:ABC transporter permease subunit [Mycoplasma bradburyae]MDC4182626.1 ABC transporter permease subunit [Mycoplasma bradburyae]UTS71071.1 ABC transporter permease subunit [Mycoplasma bradburyae]